MKTTLDLPDSLVKQVKLRALRDRRKLKDTVADLLRKGLRVPSEKKSNGDVPIISTHKKTGLPVIECQRAAAPYEELTPERLAEILLAQETEWTHAASR